LNKNTQIHICHNAGVIVVGAGIIGLSCAWRLSQQGVSVTVFDAREAAREASWAAAGMLAPGGELENPSPLARMAIDSLALYPDFIAELEDISDILIDYRRRGAIEIALNEAEAEALEGRAIALLAMGIRSESHPWEGSASARFFPDDQVVSPRDLTAALRAACTVAGVSIHEHEPVVEILDGGAGVRTGRREYRGDGVLIAAGAWSSRLWSGLPETIPVRGHLIAYRPDRELLGPILRHGKTYLVQRANGTLIAGSSTECVGFERAIDERLVNEIHRRASALLPDLSSLTPAERWNGFRPGVEGGIPVVGRIEGTAIWTAFGHYRNGILLAPETARVIAESVLSIT
jgi:glycine oxidase